MLLLKKKIPMTGVEPGIAKKTIKQKEWSRDQPSRCITPRCASHIRSQRNCWNRWLALFHPKASRLRDFNPFPVTLSDICWAILHALTTWPSQLYDKSLKNLIYKWFITNKKVFCIKQLSLSFLPPWTSLF